MLGTVDVTLTVPDGWANIGRIRAANGDGTAVVVWPSDEDVAQRLRRSRAGGRTASSTRPSDPPWTTSRPRSPTNAQRGESVPTDVTIDGYAGKTIELSVPDDINFADCDDGQFQSWEGRTHQEPGQIDRLYILDVDGQRVVIDAHFHPWDIRSRSRRASGDPGFDSDRHSLTGPHRPQRRPSEQIRRPALRRPVRAWHHAPMSFTEAQDAFFADYFRLYPINATEAGNHEHDHRWPDLTDAGAAERIAWLSDARERLAGAEAIGPRRGDRPAGAADPDRRAAL